MNEVNNLTSDVGPAGASRKGLLGTLGPIFVILLAVGVVAGISRLPERKKETAAPVIPPVNVEVLTIEPVAEMPDIFEMPGVVEVNSLVKVSAEVDGRIEKIPVVEGQPVRKGQELVRLNTDLLQADFDKAMADDECNVKEMDRVNELFAKKIANEQEMDQARTRQAVSRATRAGAKARLDRAVVRAPMSGILDRVPVKEGEYAAPGMCMAQIVDVETVKVAVQIPERDIHKLRLQDEAKVRRGETEITGKISYIGQVAEDATRTTRVEISVDNREHVLRSGQIVRTFVSRGALKDAMMIPLSAVIPLEDGKEVFCVRDGKAFRKRIALGVIKGDKVQVLPDKSCKDCLERGDRLIVSGHRFVSDGQAVKVQNGKEATSHKPLATRDGGQ